MSNNKVLNTSLSYTDYIFAGFCLAALVYEFFKSVQVIQNHSLDECVFLSILENEPESIVVQTKGGLFSNKHKYITASRGLTFYNTTRNELQFEPTVKVIKK